MKEVWKDIEGFEGYQVSNKGRFKNRFGKEIHTVIHSTGYMVFKPYLNKKRKSILAHRIIANYFVDNPNNKPEVNHINGDKTNNNPNNLEWVTPSENMKHAYKIGLKTYVDNRVKLKRNKKGQFVCA